MASKNAPLLILVADIEARAVTPITPHLDPKDVVTDALGRQWVPDSVARTLLETAEATWQETLRLQAEHREYLADRQARRQALLQKIREDSNVANTPPGHAALRARQQAALQEFDEREPEASYWEWLEKRPTMASAR